MADETPETGVKISEGDWKSLNNRLEAIDKSLKTTTTTITDQGKKITELSTPVQNVVQVRIKQYNDYDTTSNAIPLDDTIPQSTEGKQVMDIMITPQNEKNTLIIEVIALFSVNGGTYNGTIALFKDAGVDALCVSSSGAYVGALMIMLPLKYKTIAGTKNSINFKVNIGPSSGAIVLYFNGSSAARKFGDIPKSYIQVTEVLEEATIDATATK
jgi:hypothetical protein